MKYGYENPRLPSEFSYLETIAKKFVRPYRENLDDWKDFVKSLTPEQIDVVRAGYHEVLKRSDVKNLNLWTDSDDKVVYEEWFAWQLNQTSGDHSDISESTGEPQQDSVGVRIFELFDYLADLFVPPFVDMLVVRRITEPDFDWNRLPKRLSYLIQPSILWGRYETDEARRKLINRLTDEQKNELKILGNRVLDPEERQKIGEWISSAITPFNREALAVHFTMLVLIEFSEKE